MSGRISLTRDDVIATVAIDNPGKLNALTVAMWQDLARVMRELSADDALRCVVLRGAGESAFAAGADIAEFARVRATKAQGVQYHREFVYGALRAVAECRHPVVAMIHGPCVGGGLELACQSDLRIAGESARFGVPINRLGFSIAYDELIAVLPVVGRSAALEILLEGRVWDAREAFAKGLLTRIVPDAQLAVETHASVQRISAGAPLVARWHKQFIRRLTPRPAPLTAQEIDASFAYFDTEDFRLGYDAFINKTRARFQGR
ncbi:MAG: enoyl-CoA hydratase/isomerase family protein [Betaproteobacteria bacterium]|nr:enoyl-CoA hydratase/isomerase family protein [Betaproteobacteria bacterium]